jgi:hypothetical protein
MHHDRELDIAGLQTQIQIAEWNWVRRDRRGSNKERGDGRRKYVSLHGPKRQW